jgi:predicted membrane protein
VTDWLDRPWARWASLVSALATAGLVTVYPKALVTGGRVNHGLLMLLVWGMSSGFVHGVGFVPEHRALRVLLGPWVAWPLMAGGLLWMLADMTKG